MGKTKGNIKIVKLRGRFKEEIRLWLEEDSLACAVNAHYRKKCIDRAQTLFFFASKLGIDLSAEFPELLPF